jgi:hypothetical protein
MSRISASIFLFFLPLILAAGPAAGALPTRTIMAVAGAQFGDYFGAAIASVDFNGDGYADVLVGAPQNDASGTDAGRAYLYFGGPGADSNPDLFFTDGVAMEGLGFSAANAGDVNGDGYADIILGAPLNGLPGRALVYFGGALPNSIPDLALAPATGSAAFGVSVASAGDVNGDGFGDLIVGAQTEQVGPSVVGTARIFFGGTTPNSVPDVLLFGSSAGEAFGSRVAGVGDLNGDGYSDVAVSSLDWEPTQTPENYGRVRVYLGAPLMSNTPAMILSGTDIQDVFGSGIAGAGDMNADGYDDLLVGAIYDEANPAVVDFGAAYVYFGGPVLDSGPDLILSGEASFDGFGYAVASAGDVNGDGQPDIVVGAPQNLTGGSNAGRAYVFFGGPGADTFPDLIWNGGFGSRLGITVGGGGDVDGDGFADVLVAADAAYNEQPPAGQAFVFGISPVRVLAPNSGEVWVAGQNQTIRWSGYGIAVVSISTDGGVTWWPLVYDAGGNAVNEIRVVAPGVATDRAMVRIQYQGALWSAPWLDQSDSYFRIVNPPHIPEGVARIRWLAPGASGNDQLGSSVAAAGDFNADGFPDIISGAPLNDAGAPDAGRAYLHFGGAGSDATADLTFTGSAAGDQLGFAVGSAGDFNADGFADLIVGAPFNDAFASDAGQATIYYGSPMPDAVADMTLTGAGTTDAFGSAVTGIGDWNGDGYDDVAVGSPSSDATGQDGGRATLFFGGPAPDAVADLTLNGSAGLDQFGTAIAAGDVNADGYPDLLVGAPFVDDFPTIDLGRVSVYFGGPAADAVADAHLTGDQASGYFGYALAAGDTDGDAYANILVGAPGVAGGKGSVYLFSHSGSSSLDQTPVISGERTGDFFGRSVSLGDVNGDRYSDLLVGAPWLDQGGVNSGRAYVFFAGPGADLLADATYTGAPGDQLGWSLAGVRDVLGDGVAGDLAVGANLSGATDNGRVFFYDFARFFVQAPNGGETWQVGAMKEIRWLGTERADVWLSIDGGQSYELLRGGVGGAADNAAAFRVPHKPTKFARIKVTSTEPGVSGFDETDSLFTIQTSVSLLALLAAPAPSGSGAIITWSTDPGSPDLAGYRLERASHSGNDWRTVVPLTAATSYTDPDAGPNSRYRLYAVSGLGEELLLGETAFRPRESLAAWPLPYRGGVLSVSFATYGGLGGGPGEAEVALFDVSGRLVRRLARDSYPAGYQALVWDGRDDRGVRVPTGIYFLHAKSGPSGEKSLKVAVLR